MIINVIFSLILGFGLLGNCSSRCSTNYFHVVVSILKHPVNPVRVFLEKATPSYCTHCLLKNHKIK